MVHIGDSPESDVKGALSAGILPVLLDRKGIKHCQGVTTVRTLTEALLLIERQELKPAFDLSRLTTGKQLVWINPEEMCIRDSRTITLPPGHTWKSYTHFLLDTLPKRLRNNYVKKFNTSIQFWHETGGGLDEKTIQELVENGYKIRRNGVSNYTVNKKSRIVFLLSLIHIYRIQSGSLK